MKYTRIVDELEQIMRAFFPEQSESLETVIRLTCDVLSSGKKVLVFGNGGSASQAQHFAAELVNKFLKPSPAYRAVSLTTDTAAITSIANDVSYDEVFSRQVEALGDSGDLALALSTSGASPNILTALRSARRRKMKTVAFTGERGKNLRKLADHVLVVPSRETPRIQEVHLLLLHLLAQEVEERLYTESI